MRTTPFTLAVALAAIGCGNDPSAGSPTSATPVIPAQPVNPGPASLPSGGAQAPSAPPPTAAVAGSTAAPTVTPVMNAPSTGAAGASATAGAPAGAAGAGVTQPSVPPSGLPDVTFELDVKVPAGVELLECKYVAMPSDRGVIAVPAAESHYTPGSHHLLAYRTQLTTAPVDHTGTWDCTDGSWVINSRGSYYEAQQPDSHRELPPGIAHEFKPGEIVLLQSHYVNTTDKDIDAHVSLIMHTMDLKDVKQEAGSILWSNPAIAIAPHTKERITMTCTLPADFHPAELWSHMHKQGINFIATSDDKTAAAVLGDSLYSEPDWNEPKPRNYPSEPPVTLHANSKVTFSCDFQNDTDRMLTYGDSAQTNEMCILHGMYWPRMTAASGGEACRGGVTSRTPL